MKSFIYIVLLTLFTQACASRSTSDVDSEIADCKRVIMAYPALRDSGSTDEYLNLFTEDAEFSVKALGLSLQGSAQIGKRFEKARATTKTLHTMGVIKVEHVSNKQYSAESSFEVRIEQLSEVKPSIQTIKGYYTDTFQVSNGQCRIQSRHVRIKPKGA